VTALLDGLPDAMVPEAPFPLPAPRQADAIPPAQRASDASVAVHPDEAMDAIVPVPAVSLYVEKSAVRERVVPVPDAAHLVQALPAEAPVPCTPDAGRSAA
jgi:hypothetical protein